MTAIRRLLVKIVALSEICACGGRYARDPRATHGWQKCSVANGRTGSHECSSSVISHAGIVPRLLDSPVPLLVGIVLCVMLLSFGLGASCGVSMRIAIETSSTAASTR